MGVLLGVPEGAWKAERVARVRKKLLKAYKCYLTCLLHTRVAHWRHSRCLNTEVRLCLTPNPPPPPPPHPVADSQLLDQVLHLRRPRVHRGLRHPCVCCLVAAAQAEGQRLSATCSAAPFPSEGGLVA